MRHIDIDDSESVLRAVRETPAGKSIEIILHTPGGLVLAASQIARALGDHSGRVIAVDPQLGQYAARSLVEVAAMPGSHEDQTLLMADVAQKALRQVQITTQR